MTKEDVLELMNNAEQNGYPDWNKKPSVVANEIWMFADIEDSITVEEIEAHVIQIQKEYIEKCQLIN